METKLSLKSDIAFIMFGYMEKLKSKKEELDALIRLSDLRILKSNDIVQGQISDITREVNELTEQYRSTLALFITLDG